MHNNYLLIWDTLNVQHIARHDISPQDVEEANTDPQIITRSTYGDRIARIGVTQAGKVITFILAKSANGYYVVTARPASRKEREQYEQK